MNETDFIISLYKYFSRFVPKEVLKKMLIQPEKSRRTGYSEIEAELLALPDTDIIPEFETFVVSINEKFISERVRNNKGFILFVEYGKISAEYGTVKGIQESLAITVAHHFSDNNNDNLNEILLMNQCLNILNKIIQTMISQQEELDSCADQKLITFPVDIQVVDPVSFYGNGGWCAMFNNANTIL